MGTSLPAEHLIQMHLFLSIEPRGDKQACEQASILTTSLGIKRLPQASSSGGHYQALCASLQPGLGLSQAEMLQAVDLAEALGSLKNINKALAEYFAQFYCAGAEEGRLAM